MMTAWIALALAAAQPAPIPTSPPVMIYERQEGGGSHTLSHEVLVDGPVAQVWQAIVTPEGWRTWAVPVARMVPGDSNLMETSYSPNSRPGDASTIRQRLVARLPQRILVFRTERAPAGFPHFASFARVTSFFELEEYGARRTRVRLTGTGYPNTEAGRQLLRFFREGNRVSLERLRQRFLTGPLNWSEILRRGN